MRVLLLAAGLGTRLRPLTDHTPKCLVLINGRPLLDYWLELISKAGIKEVLINLHHFPDKVLAYLDSCKYPIKISTTYEKKLLGTGGTILANQLYFKDEPFMVVHADNLSSFNISNFIHVFNNRSQNIEITMMTFYTDAPETCGIVETDNDGIVVNFHEKIKKPPSNFANAAIYIFSPSIFIYLQSLSRDIIDISTDIIPNYLGKINIFHNEIYHRDIGSMNSYSLAQIEFPRI